MKFGNRQFRNISAITDAFSFATGKIDSASDISRCVFECHLGRREVDKKYFIDQLSEIATSLTNFAFSQPLFSAVKREDQVHLLKNNIPLYLQYVMARYFTAETGFEQVSRIMETPLAPGSENLYCLINLRDFHQKVNLFPNPEMFELYSHHCQTVGLFFQFPLKVTSAFF